MYPTSSPNPGPEVYGVCQATFYRWRKEYGSLSRSVLQELKELKREHGRLKKIVADLTLDKQILRDVLSEEDGGPHRLRRPIAARSDRALLERDPHPSPAETVIRSFLSPASPERALRFWG